MRHQVTRFAPLLMRSVFKKIFPEVSKQLHYWKTKADAIPNIELREQALASISSKKFHCQGGSVYSVLAEARWKDAIQFIVAYQTISDYLDNLCDRSTSLDPKDFRMLHQSMEDALSPEAAVKNYYQFREDQNDGGYLTALVQTCQEALRSIPSYEMIQSYCLRLEQLYSDLQVHKHVKKEERIPRLENWFQNFKEKWPSLSWYEFSASSGSTLGIFCMIGYAMGGKMNVSLAENILESYFPFMQGLHILLDYYIDQQEDLEEDDLNFCNYYRDETHLKERLLFFIKQTNKSVQLLPHKHFHEMVHNGLVGLYLADPKVKDLQNGKQITRMLLQASGIRSTFFHINIKLYNRLKGKTQEA
ncbi:tetraprenyl-beta-curcumene synthase [Paraliobacillus ryukyuensis]|uniref:Tetraprenyl-beta-curcumene synthase n=1 Tax=Paraliobacillus ryukyuensis TaxID=200904 RepID=A0A366E750_9BACI|nr:tetraprenyl-beta-curcumene synthase family protein [Paraliobacillus ryukyuensis]RBO98137.1 tetraprenyl-beta-curcumene synthase [Paraliobacillus ryukyuensis]